MKKLGNISLIISFFLLSLTIISCGGGGGDASGGSGTGANNYVPVIKDVRIFRQSEPQNPIDPSNGTVVVKPGEYLFYKIYYSDQDVNVNLAFFTSYYPSTSTKPFMVFLPLGTTQSIVEDTFTSPEFMAGYGNLAYAMYTGHDDDKWRLEFQLEDSNGNRSGIFVLYAEVRK